MEQHIQVLGFKFLLNLDYLPSYLGSKVCIYFFPLFTLIDSFVLNSGIYGIILKKGFYSIVDPLVSLSLASNGLAISQKYRRVLSSTETSLIVEKTSSKSVEIMIFSNNWYSCEKLSEQWLMRVCSALRCE